MKNFYRLFSDIDTTPHVMELMANPGLWNANDIRTKYEQSPHYEVDDILMRFNDLSNISEIVDDKDCLNYPAMFALPRCADLIYMLMGYVRGERLGRCIVAKLPPGGKIAPHVDEGAPADYYDRYHIVLQAAPGCMFQAGDEKIMMKKGDIWWFDNKQQHTVINNSVDDRICLIVDIRLPRQEVFS